MIDIHLHLDGSLSVEDFQYLSKLYGVDLGKDFPNNIYVPENCQSLEEYLTRFALPGQLLQSKEAIKYVTKSLVKRLYELGYIYAEIRFAPLLHTEKGASQLEITEAALEGLNEQLKECPGFDAGLILCCMRHASKEMNMETIEVAHKLQDTKVVAVDLAGAERLHPSSYYKEIFDLAKQYKLNITIHAGEATGSDEIMMALDNGAMRIGHGVHLSLDADTIRRVKEKNICFEFCPTSNLQTKSLLTYKDVPLRQFLDNNIDVTINSDNMTVSNTNAIIEMRKMKETFNLSKEEIYHLLSNSINHAFVNENKRVELKRKLDEKFTEFYKNL